MMATTSDAERLARLLKEAVPLTRAILKHKRDDIRDAAEICGVNLHFLTYFLCRLQREGAPPDQEDTAEADFDMTPYHGPIREWFPDKGYGYIDCDDGSEAYFIVTVLYLFGWKKPLPPGTLVTFHQRLDGEKRRQVFRFLAIGLATSR
jgi:hypothetical protein